MSFSKHEPVILAQRPPLPDWDAVCSQWLRDSNLSSETIAAYRRSVRKLTQWCFNVQRSAQSLSREDIQSFARALAETEGLSVYRVNAIKAHLTSFFAWVTQRHPQINNPLVKQRAKAISKVTRIRIPSQEELALIIENVPADVALAVAVLAYTGIPMTSLPALEIERGMFRTYYRGRAIEGKVPSELEPHLIPAGPGRWRPFKGVLAERIGTQIRVGCIRLVDTEKLRQRYSPRDFLYFYVLHSWPKNPDLEHTTARVGYRKTTSTENMLARLGLIG